MTRIIERNSTSNIIRLALPDPDLLFNTDGVVVSVISGATVYAYSFGASGAETIATIGTYVAPTAGKCRFKLVGAQFYGATSSLYELQLANAVFTNTGYGVDIFVTNGVWDSHYAIQYQEPFTIAPVVGSSTTRTVDTTITTFSGEDYLATVSGVDADGNTIDWRINGLVFVVDGNGTTDKLVIQDANIAKTSTYFQVTIPASTNVADNVYNWSIRVAASGLVMLKGKLIVRYAADEDAA